MKKIPMFFLIFFLPVILLQDKVYSSFNLENEVKNKIKSHIVETLNGSIQGKMHINIGNISSSNMKTVVDPDCTIKIESNFTNNYSSRSVVRVIINDANANTRIFGVPVSVQVFDNVLVSTQKIEKGETITVRNVTVAWKDISHSPHHAIRADSLIDHDLVATKLIPVGKVLDNRFIQGALDIHTGSTVSVIFDSQSLNVAVDGRAMDDGKLGDVIKVKMKQFHKDFYGEIIGKNIVKVAL